MKRLLTQIIFFFTIIEVAFAGGNAAYKRYSIRDGLPNNQILKTWIDSKGYIWGNTWEGGFRFDGDKFYNFKQEIDKTDEEKNILRSRFIYFYETISSVIIGTSKGIAFFDTKGITCFPIQNHIINKYRRIDDKIYLQTKDSLFSFCLNDKIYKKESVSSSAKHKNLFLTKKNSYYLYTIKEGEIIKAEEEQYKLNEDQFCIRRTKDEILDYIPKLNDVLIWDILTDKNDITWIGTEQGLLRMPPPAFINYTKQDGIPNYVWSISEDIDGTLWFATYGNGIFKYSKGKYTKENITNLHTHKPILRYYMGAAQTSTGFLQPHETGVLKREHKQWSQIKELPKTAYLYVYNDEEANITFYSGADTLSIYRKGEYEKYPAKTLLGNCPLIIVKDKKDRYWMGARTPATVHRYKDGEFVGFEKDEIPFLGGCLSADKDLKANLWIGNYDGLFCYSYNKIDTIPIKNPSIICAVKSYKDSIILASAPGGLHCINLAKYYAQEKDYYTFFSSDLGLTVEDLGQQGIIVDKKENIWIISSSGVTRFYPDRVKLSINVPEPIIYSIQYSPPSLIWEKKDLLFSDFSKTLKLNYPICNISIDFGAISTSINKDVSHSYKIEGYHNKWIETTKEEKVVVTNLPPGQYIFKLRCKLENNDILAKEKHLYFIIKPTFWQTSIFKIFVFASAIILIVLLIYLYVRSNKKRFLREIQVTNIQLANIKSQLNPHFIFNTMNSIGAKLIDTNSSVYPPFSKLARLIRTSLQDADYATKPIIAEIEFITEYLELQKFRFKSNIDYSIEISPEVNKQMLIPKMSIQLLVENAVTHGIEGINRKGIVSVKIEKDTDNTIISVTDNGAGFSQTNKNKGNGIGLKNLQKIIEIYNRFNKEKCSLKIETEENKGSTVIIYIPNTYNFVIKRKQKR